MYIAELWGVLENLKIVVAMDLINITMEVDSQQVVNDIDSNNRTISWEEFISLNSEHYYIKKSM